jgi:polyphosphate kinase
VSEVLAVILADNIKARFLQPDGSYRYAKPDKDEKPRRSQFKFVSLAMNAVETATKTVDGRAKRTQVKLAPSPFAPKKG